MSLITIYKGDRSIFVDNSPNGLEIMKKAGWTEKAPQGWGDRDVVVEDTIDSLRTENVELVELAQACTAANVDLVKDNKKLSKQVKYLTAKVKELGRSGKGKAAKQTKRKEVPVEQEEEKKGESD